MELRLLQYFPAVAREENITRAAASLHISQPSLSRQLMELEQETGRQMLRGKRKITLTEDGALLRKRAEEILALMEKTERELSSDAAQICGEVAIGGNPTASVLRAAAAVRSAYPEIRFRFYSSDATDVAERLEHGSLDFSVLLAPIDTAKYEYHALRDSARWGLLLPETCPLAGKAVMCLRGSGTPYSARRRRSFCRRAERRTSRSERSGPPVPLLQKRLTAMDGSESFWEQYQFSSCFRSSSGVVMGAMPKVCTR